MQIKEIAYPNCKYLIQNPRGRDLPATLSPATALGVRAFHRQLPGYKPTPLVRLERLVRAWGFKDIFVKDESPRFGQIPLTTATDGDAADGVAWAAERWGQKVLIYMPRGTAPSRVAANGMQILANPLRGDPSVEARESNAVGIGLMDLLAHHTAFETLKDGLEIGPDSTLLCFNTEGATDPINYQEVIWQGRYPSID